MIHEYIKFVKEHHTAKTLPHLEAVLGLASEAGEVSGEVCKALRREESVNKDKLTEELGDVLFYFLAVCNRFGVDLDKVILHNMLKLTDRKRRKGDTL